MENQKLYSPEWFAKQKNGSLSSADIILPIVMDLASPRSVVDIGCGVGGWLNFFVKNGVKDILGIDGEWIDESQLLIPKQSFKKVNINESFSVGRKADLAISLEVGEHLAEKAADGLVKALTDTAPVVLFSAAIPEQPGTGHVNGQWPEYWAQIFGKYGFIPVDCIRRKVWTNPNVEYWYAQNILIYVKKSSLASYPKLAKEVECGYSSALPLVHPKRYYYALKPLPPFFFRVRRKIVFICRKYLSK